MTVVLDHLRHHVDHRLGEPLGALRTEYLPGAVCAELGDQLVGQVVAADDDRVRLAANLGGARRALRDRAKRVLVEGALVVQDVDQNVGHI